MPILALVIAGGQLVGLAAQPVRAQQPPATPLRIGLVRTFGHPSSVTVAASSGAILSNESGSQLAAGPATWRISASPQGVSVADSDGKELGFGKVLSASPGELRDQAALAVAATGRARRYRGSIELRADTSGVLTVVNLVPVEEYLRGVIPLEMPSSAPSEALKAQAVVARSYALKLRGRYASRGYDLTDATDSQMYGGVEAEKPSTDAAVAQTSGIVLYREGRLLLADYYDDCGGVTSPGVDDGDYPPSVSDTPPGARANYCAAGLYHTWTLELTGDDLAKAVPADERARLGPITDVRIARTDSSGRAAALTIDSGSASVTIKGSAFRARLGYDRLKSTLFTVTRTVNGTFLFAGRGYGHGHGMCQMGAIGMAAAPYHRSFEEILAHYFPGSTVAPSSEAHPAAR